MRLYTVQTRPWSATVDPVLVKEGFSWPAALFTVFWALWHGLWVAAVVILVLITALGAGLTLVGADAVSNAVVQVGFQAVLGFIGNDLRRRDLARRGLVGAGVVAGRRRTDAEFRYFAARAGTFAPAP